MGQIFHPSANTIARLSLIGGVVAIFFVVTFALTYVQSPYITQMGVVREQPIPFSHKHHAGDLGIDCRYCHTSVEDSSFAGLPATEICMNCHTQIWKDSPALAPVRDSFQTGQPIAWTRVDNLPDYVYFDHSIHVAKGVACVTCHGQVDDMPIMAQSASMLMTWCLNCHRDPAPNLRPADQVFNMNWTPPPDLQQLQEQLMVEYNVTSKTNCSTCHR